MPLVVAGTDTLTLGHTGVSSLAYGEGDYGEGLYGGGGGSGEITETLSAVTESAQTLSLISEGTQTLTTASETSL